MLNFLAAIDSVRFDLSGAAVAALVARVAPARAGHAAALAVLETADLAGLGTAAASLTAARVAADEVSSVIDALAGQIALPRLEPV